MKISSSKQILVLSVWIGANASVKECFGWHSDVRRSKDCRHPQTHSSSRLFSTTDPSAVSQNGVEEFEAWFSGVSGATCSPYIKHSWFGNLRGLGTQDKSISSSNDSWMTIPRSIVLESDFSRPDWDAQLAQSLWREVMKGASGSSVSGYVSLLTKSWTKAQLPSVPPFTAPDALRHWSEEEKAILSADPEGQALLDLQAQQEKMWREKYKSIEATSSMTWEEFEWAMEAVHSRAFCGDFGTNGGSSLPMPVALGTPAAAALGGYIYYVQLHGQNDIVLLALAAVGAIPTVLNLVNESPPVAVLLPLIDSANHLEEADSLIEYSPLTNSFDLKGGSKCLLAEDDGKQQLYISYGKKSNKELLLNYGFLKGVVASTGDSDSERRKKLAEKFLSSQ